MLFIGNSLTYVGNLPAVLDALSVSNGRPVVSDMIAKGGATLTERASDDIVEKVLKARHYQYVVLQERGGDFMCAFGPRSCEGSRTALNYIVELARAHAATPILLGTYQSNIGASEAIVQAEQRAAAECSVPYISVSDRLQLALAIAPTSQWFYSDGIHPGHDLILLEALLLLNQLTGPLPALAGFTVHGAMYAPQSHLPATVVGSAELAAVTDRSEYTYTAEAVAAVLAVANETTRLAN